MAWSREIDVAQFAWDCATRSENVNRKAVIRALKHDFVSIGVLSLFAEPYSR